MTVTTSYGTWNNHVDPSALNLDTTVCNALEGNFSEETEDTIADVYRDAINAALPASVYLSGSEFIGPARDEDVDWDGELDIAGIVESVDFWEIVKRVAAERGE